MKVNIEEKQGKHIVTLEGEMDTAAAADIEQKLCPLYETEGKEVVVDCTHLEYIASSGLRILLHIQKSNKAKGGNVTLRNVSEDIMGIFRLTGFNKIFDFE